MRLARLGMSRHHPVDWNHPEHPLAKKEPRVGRRAILAATIHCPDGPLLCYCLHLEVFCGMLARIAQFADVLHDSKQQLTKGQYHQAILGDLNTMAHGIARLSANYCCDKMRFWSLGQSEGAFWHRNVISIMDSAWDPARDGRAEAQAGEDSVGNGAGAPQETARKRAPAAPASATPGSVEQSGKAGGGGAQANARLQYWGVPADVCKDVTNPGFHDPFDPDTTTLDNPSYRIFRVSLMKGKLDWLLLRRLKAVATSIGNHDYKASDHKWLAADVVWQ
ncbi:hypothetical protein WJX72_012209 [[Myrmecia] bisecta]|uniref:Endonuclease/exonuclease/phosphatase domain-containing protein n=1 Tax=[Myrmecia] bisecta TaxID=41462 RepID=A0AAW1QGL9_9CHLO